MKVKLLKTILEGRSIKASIRSGRRPVVFVEDAVIDMSEASAKKYIDAKLAEPYIEKVEIPSVGEANAG